MRRTIVIFIILAVTLILTINPAASQTGPVWPGPPDQYRVKYIGQILCQALRPEGGFLKRVSRWLGGKDEQDRVSMPFDLVVQGNSVFMICQNIPALIEINRAENTFRRHVNKNYPLKYPIAVCDGGEGTVFVSDTKRNAIYQFADNELRLTIDSGLIRPTGIAALPELRRLIVVDTGEQSVKIYDYDGNLLRVIGAASDTTVSFNYPTFAAASADNQFLINDALNYRIKRFDLDGNLLGSFGREGDGPGTFARPKGLATDSDGQIYVVDNLFDNVQIFNAEGQVLLAVGSSGKDKGQFWSPAGIDIHSDTIFIADTFNHRVQILFYRSDTP